MADNDNLSLILQLLFEQFKKGVISLEEKIFIKSDKLKIPLPWHSWLIKSK